MNFSKTDEGMVVSNPAQDVEEQVAEKVVTEFVKGTEGSVMVSAVAEPEEDPLTAAANSAEKTDIGAVVSVPADMEEVSWQDLNQQAVALQEDVVATVKGLVGQLKGVVEKSLEKMVKDAQIGSFRVINPGQGSTADYVINRVQVFTDKDDVVRDVVVG